MIEDTRYNILIRQDGRRLILTLMGKWTDVEVMTTVASAVTRDEKSGNTQPARAIECLTTAENLFVGAFGKEIDLTPKAEKIDRKKPIKPRGKMLDVLWWGTFAANLIAVALNVLS